MQKYSKIFKKVLDISGNKSIIMHITALLYTLLAILQDSKGLALTGRTVFEREACLETG